MVENTEDIGSFDLAPDTFNSDPAAIAEALELQLTPA